jgi:hypothetical protein
MDVWYGDGDRRYGRGCGDRLVVIEIHIREV